MPSVTNSGFNAYENYLSLDLSPDYWSDEGITIAQEMLSSFADKDWSALTRTWSSRVRDWRIRCAETLDAARKPALAILLSMLEDTCDDVVLEAAEALSSNAQVRREDFPVERIHEIKRGATATVSLALSAVLARVSA